MPRVTFAWLHLTDLHMGLDDDQWLWPNFREAFYEDLIALHERSGPWDMVLFTGDLTQTGNLKQYQRLNGWLSELWGHLSDLGSTPALLAIPGNHDLLRPDPEKPEIVVLEEFWARPALREGFWRKSKSAYRSVVRKVFRNYLEWDENHKLPRVPRVNAGLLPGDFSCVVEKQGARLGILGLNSTFLQLTSGAYQGRLALHRAQLHEACRIDGQPDGSKWVKGNHACLLLTHPPDWLHSSAVTELEQQIAPAGRFAVHLFGHMHETCLRSLSLGGSKPRRLWQGCSLFGLEQYGTNELRMTHGYSAGQIVLENDKGFVRMWPRVSYIRQGGERVLIPDPSVKLKDDQGTEPEGFQLFIPYRASSKSDRADKGTLQLQTEHHQSLLLNPGELLIKYSEMLEKTWTLILKPEVRKYCSETSSSINSGLLVSNVDDIFFNGLHDLFCRLYNCPRQLELQRSMFKNYTSPDPKYPNLFEWEQSVEYGDLNFRDAVRDGIDAFRLQYYPGGVQKAIEKDQAGFIDQFMRNIETALFGRNSLYAHEMFMRYHEIFLQSGSSYLPPTSQG